MPQGTCGQMGGLPATGASWHSVWGLERGQTEGAYLRAGWIFLLQSKNIFSSFWKEMTHLKEALSVAEESTAAWLLGVSWS